MTNNPIYTKLSTMTLLGLISSRVFAGVEISAEDYLAAENLLESKVAGLVKNVDVQPNWLEDGKGFWYRRDGEQRKEFVVVDIASGKKSFAFDHDKLLSGLNNVLEEEVKESDLGAMSLDSSLSSVHGVLQSKQVRCDRATMACSVEEIAVPAAEQLLSPAGKYAAVTRDNNLYLLDRTSGRERKLTRDGEPYFGYGKMPDTGLMTIQIKKHGIKLPPFAAQFSPDDRYLMVPRIDEREVKVNPFVEWVPTDGSLRPVVHQVRQHFTGDRKVPKIDLFVWNTKTRKRVRLDIPQNYSTGGMAGHIIGWSLKREQAYLIARTVGSRDVALLQADLNSGRVKRLVEESVQTKFKTNTEEYNQPNVRVINDGDEVIWFSERSGWGHLYLYDGQTGKLKNAITGGDWLVQDIHQLDLDNRQVYFTAGGKEPGRDPYYRHLYKVSLDGGKPVLLTAENADHSFPPQATLMFSFLFKIPPAPDLIRPDLGVFIDSWSTVDTPPVTALRSTRDGSLIAVLEEADASALYAAGWKAPIRKAMKAADGKTDVYSVYYPPLKKLPDGKHPVIDAVYGGPQVFVAPRDFVGAFRASNPGSRSALARLGFAVVTTDGRGTPQRSKAFDDVGYPEFTQVAIDDHIAVIKQWAEDYPEMDTARVGIFGWSWGGTFSGQAILSRPEFYDVAVSGAGVYDYAALYPGFEPFTGVPEYKNGSIYREELTEKPANWDKLDITAMADNLKGKLMIVYGDMDENVPQNQAFLLVDALIKANKPYDLLYLPNRTHGGGAEAYTIQRRFDYFVEHLLDAEPPADVVFTNAPRPPLR